MTNLYTNAVLTIIALSLCVIALQNIVQPAAALADNCGNRFDPCYVQVLGTVSVEGSVSTY